MKRLFVSEITKPVTLIGGNDAHHLIHVLRVQLGKEILLADAAGRCAKGRVESVADGMLSVMILADEVPQGEPLVAVTLVQALPKGDKMEWIIQKSVELGVKAIQPVESERVVVKYDGAKRENRRQRWQKIAQEAAQQCGRSEIPQIQPICAFSEYLQNVSAQYRIMLYEEEQGKTLKETLQDCSIGTYALVIGPEGGLTATEAQLAQQAGFVSVSLGPRILRTETAALAGVAAILYEHGDLGGK